MTRPVGRPRASSREMLAEAACELFLERGYDATSATDIAARAGVSRSSFFNYFRSKADILWCGLDERIDALDAALAEAGDADAPARVRAAILDLGARFAPDSLALALVHARAMGLTAELEREAAVRRGRIAAAVAGALARGGADPIAAEVGGAAWGGAVLAAIGAWARAGAGRATLTPYLRRAADAAERGAA